MFFREVAEGSDGREKSEKPDLEWTEKLLEQPDPKWQRVPTPFIEEEYKDPSATGEFRGLFRELRSKF